MRRYTLEVNGKAFTLDVDELAADRFIVTAGDNTYEVRLSGDEDLPGATISPGVEPVGGMGSHHAPVRAPSVPPAARSQGNGSGPTPPPSPVARTAPTVGGAAGKAVLTAPMPGVILEVSIAAGASVTRGQPVLILEAMKMRNTICAPRDGVVAEVLVSAGQSVGHGEGLLRFEEAGA